MLATAGIRAVRSRRLDDWADDENDRQRIDVEVELVAADRLTVTPTNGGRTVTYEPTETNPGCD